MTMKTTAIAQWYGSNRTLAATVGKQLGKLDWCGVPFCGGCPELSHIKARTGMASDLHRHIINLARVIRNPELNADLRKRLDATLFHPDELEAAQRSCLDREAENVGYGALFGYPEMDPQRPADYANIEWAYDYAISTWMGQGGRGGCPGEFEQKQSMRWTASGGDSCTRFRSFADSLEAWNVALRPWNFVCMNAFKFLEECKDNEGHGVYTDPPWVEEGGGYTHPFTERMHRDLAKRQAQFKTARVVVRYGDCPLIREIYPASNWNFIEQTSRAQTNDDVNEVLIINGRSFA